MENRLMSIPLDKIFTLGKEGKLGDMSQEDWQVLHYVVNNACKRNYMDGEVKGYRVGWREGRSAATEELWDSEKGLFYC